MAASKQWKLLLAMGALTLAVSACGSSDDKKPTTNGDGDGDGDTGDAGAGGDGDNTMPAVTPLPAMTAGKACKSAGDCGGADSACADNLTGGSLLTLISGFAGTDLSMKVDGGFCTLACTKAEDCGEGGTCFGLAPAIIPAQLLGGSSAGECRAKCSADADCSRSGYECGKFDMQAASDALAGIGGGAAPAGGGGSALDPSMLLGFVSSSFPPSCIPKPTPDKLKDGEAGKACETADDCGDGTCVGASANGTKGSCSGVCLADSDCGAGARCQAGFYGSAGNCVETCEQNSDCARAADGFTCTDIGGNKMCVPPAAQNGDAGAGDAGGDAGDTSNDKDAGADGGK